MTDTGRSTLGRLRERLRARARRLGDRMDRRATETAALIPVRSADRYLGGVAGGLARTLDVDPFVVRLAVALATLYFPVVVVLYTVAWVVMPDARTGRSLVASIDEPGGWRALLGVVALGIGAAYLAPELGPDGNTGLRAGVVFIVLGLLLVLRRPGVLPWSPPEPADRVTPEEPDAPAPGARSEPEASAAPRVREPRSPSYLGWFGLSALLLLVGIAGALDYGGLRPVAPGVVAALGLVVVGAVLLLGAWWGRARILLPVGLVLLLPWVAWSMDDVPRFDGEGDVRHVVADEPLPDSFEHGYGTMRIDLRQARFEAGDRQTLHVGLTAGTVRITVPRDVHVDVTGTVGAGDVEIWDEWRAVDSGFTVGRDVDLHAGRWRGAERCQRRPVYPSDFDPTAPGVEIVEPTWEYRDVNDEPCTPERPAENPSHLEIDLQLGVVTVEVHRV